jgi:predicted nucleic acid-binding protein
VRITFDTDVLLSAADADGGLRHRQAVDLVARAMRADTVLILQTLAEFYAVATGTAGLPADRALHHIAEWRDAFPVRAATESDLFAAADAVRRHGIGFWDALLWATARRNGCAVLLGGGPADGPALTGVRRVDPFAPANAVLLEVILPPGE